MSPSRVVTNPAAAAAGADVGPEPVAGGGDGTSLAGGRDAPESSDETTRDAADAVGSETRLLGPVDTSWLAASLTPLMAGFARNSAQTTDAVAHYSAEAAALSARAVTGAREEPRGGARAGGQALS